MLASIRKRDVVMVFGGNAQAGSADVAPAIAIQPITIDPVPLAPLEGGLE